jgi:hypothetical protein
LAVVAGCRQGRQRRLVGLAQRGRLGPPLLHLGWCPGATVMAVARRALASSWMPAGTGAWRIESLTARPPWMRKASPGCSWRTWLGSTRGRSAMWTRAWPAGPQGSSCQACSGTLMVPASCTRVSGSGV